MYVVPKHCKVLLHDVQYTRGAGVLDADSDTDGVRDGGGAFDGVWDDDVPNVHVGAVIRPVVRQPAGQGHGTGALIPLVGQCDPIGHVKHALMADAPALGLYEPLAHGRHALMADAPALGLYEPLGHGRHALMADAPALGLYVPLEQAVIVPEPVVQNDPAGHASKYATIVIPAATTETSEYSEATIGAPQNEKYDNVGTTVPPTGP